MPGSAVLDPDVLVDSLVTDVIDGLRGDLHPAFGVRAYRVYTVLRQWSGRSVGEGSYQDTETEIDPQPFVARWDGLRFNLEPCGIDELGEIVLTEVSLTYTEAELTGRPLEQNQQFMIKLTDAHGQQSTEKYFIHTKPPYVDREEDMGWVVWLRAV